MGFRHATCALLGLGLAALVSGCAPTRATPPPTLQVAQSPPPGVTAPPTIDYPVFFMPVEGARVAEVASSFGDPRGTGRLHEGIDIMAERGTPVRAAAPGTVRRVSNTDLGGLSITVIGYDGLRYFYTHFDSFAAGLAEGDNVGIDTVIGYVGNTGNASATAPHLHFAVYRPTGARPYSWQAFDPLPFLLDHVGD